MPSFDIVSKVDTQEVKNAVDQASRELGTRFDFKGTDARFELQGEKITLYAPSEFQLKQMLDIMTAKLIKRGIIPGSLDIKEHKSNLKEAQQIIEIKQGIDTELAKRLVKIIKESKFKAQAAIQEDQVRVTGKQRDDLQDIIALLRQQNITLPLQFVNFRD